METEKDNNISNIFLNQNNNQEPNINLSYYSQEKFEFITKSKEMNTFKEEILSYLRERDSFFIEKINNLQFNTDINTKKIEQLSENIENNYNSFLTKQVELSTKIEKIKSYEAFMNKANDKLISQEIRLNTIREDMSKNWEKYDKIYLENLIVPGYIGKGAKYCNCKIFFSEVIKELDKLNTFKEKNVLDLTSYKDRLENIIKTFQFIVDNYNNSQIKYITKLNDQTNKNLLEILEEKLKNLRMENSHFSIDLIKKSNELNKIYDKVKLIRNNILQEFNNIFDEYKKKVEDTNKSFEEYKSEQNHINKKYMNYFNLIKVGKFQKNFGFQLGFRQNKDLRNIKNKYEQNNYTELKNIFDIKQSNIISKRLSKSQNNFNSSNNIINLRRNINIATNPKRIELKKHRNSIDSILNYSRTSSVKGPQKGNNILKYNLSIKRQKGFKSEIPLINTSKSQRNDQTTLNLLHSLKTEKEKEKMTSYEEGTDLKTNAKEDDELSISGTALSNMNNSINTYSTTNENNNTISNIINIKTKTDGFNLNEKEKAKDSFDEHNDNDNDKIIKEIASELEQSTAKGNILCSNKKEIEKNFKLVCDKIQPINLKLNNQKNLEKIEESGEKNILEKFSNKSDQNTTLFSNNNLNNININNFNINESNLRTNLKDILEKNKLKELLQVEDNDAEKIYNDNKGAEKENMNIDQRMNNYDTKLVNLESFTKDKFFELIKQINYLKKHYAIISNFIKKEKKIKNLNSIRITEYKTMNNTNISAIHKRENIIGNLSITNNENKNTLNLTSNYFNKKPPMIEISSRLNSISKNNVINDENNLSQNLFHNGKYYLNIKDIFGQKKFENKKLLKPRNSYKDKENKENIAFNNNDSDKNSFVDKKEKYIDLKQFRTNNNKSKF